MCTVTIIPLKGNDFVLTSNRDEAPNRVSLAPDFYTIQSIKVLFPKDEMSGGTWIGLSEKNRVICVLNGGFVVHERKDKYRKSRGLVANDFMLFDNMLSGIESYNLIGVEPFTMVIIDWNVSLKFFELVWDGEQKHFKQLPLKPKIWSSSTLYSDAMKLERSQWFDTYQFKNELNSNSILQFHKTAGFNNLDYGVIMDRGFVKTTSITQVRRQIGTLKMHYENLQNNEVTEKLFNLSKVVNE